MKRVTHARVRMMYGDYARCSRRVITNLVDAQSKSDVTCQRCKQHLHEGQPDTAEPVDITEHVCTYACVGSIDFPHESDDVDVKQLSSGWFHIRGFGPCEWSQPPTWPCSEDEIRRHAFPQASERFIHAACRLANRDADDEESAP